MNVNSNKPGNFQSEENDDASRSTQGGVDEELGFDPDSPDISDPQVDPVHPARTSNDPEPSKGPTDRSIVKPGS